VSILIIGYVLGSVVYLATSEELLSVGGVVEDHTEGSSHVDSLAVRVVEDVLS